MIEGKNTLTTLAVPTPKRTNTSRMVQIMIGSIPVNLYPTDSVLITSTNEPPSSLRAHVVESTLQEVYPCSPKGKSRAIIMKKKVVNIPHPQRKCVKKVKITDVSRDQIPVSQGGVPKPQDQSRT
ncbi:hypothetical protein L3X38_012401 [Prunus dulcis]|uniref:Uncharacterized protein n=1 Tax=Prunus dulcis TaxID=3755 RepID=A0AAD4WKV8_PRUDU|nr:hypothetical protein L3X38_012401 [Prunus dulcis]